MNDAEKKWCNVKLSLILYGKLCAFRVQRYKNFCDFIKTEGLDKLEAEASKAIEMIKEVAMLC